MKNIVSKYICVLLKISRVIPKYIYIPSKNILTAL